MRRAFDLVSRYPRDALAVALILYVFVAVALTWAPRSVWSPDALAYQVKVLEIRGATEEEATDQVWFGPLAAGFREADASRPAGSRALDDPRWIEYASSGYDRRILVPALAALVYPLADDDSLEVVAAAGTLAFALLLFVLLRLRFPPFPSAVAVVLCLAFPGMRWGFEPLTEGWGLALVVLALIAALMFCERGGRWLYVWAAAVLALGFTRDLTPVPVAAAVVLLIVLRTPRTRALAVTGVIAALVAPLAVGGGSLRESLAFTFSGNRVPDDSSWGFVLDNYLPAVERTVRGNFDVMFIQNPAYLDLGWPLFALVLPLLAGLLILLVVRPRAGHDSFLILMRGSLLGAVAYLALLPDFTYYRRELALLPAAAAGIAVCATLVSRRLRDPLP